MVACAFKRIVGKLRICAHQSHGSRPGGEFGGHFKEASRQFIFAIGAISHHLKVLVVFELVVQTQGQIAHHQFFTLNDQGHGRRDQIGTGSDQHVHLVNVDQLGIQAGRYRWICLVIVNHQLNFATQ